MNFRAFLLSFFISLFFGLSAFAQQFSTGLKLATPEQLRGIPLASTPFSGNELKRKVDLSANMPSPGNQGAQNSCVGWAVGYSIKSYQEKLEENSTYYDQAGNVRSDAVFSPSYIYNQINQGRDGGCYIMDALNLVSQKGAVKWADMPYSEYDYLTAPRQSHHEKAKTYRIDFWRQVNVQDLKEVKAQVQAGYPVVIGAAIDQAFFNDGLNNPNYVWRDLRGNTSGHAMSVVGYDDDKGAFKLMNSWGQNWGSKGYGWLSYDLWPRVVSEGYVMKDAFNGPGNEEIANNDKEIELIDPNILFDDDKENVELTDPEDIFDEDSNNTWDNTRYEPTSYLTTQFFVDDVLHNITHNFFPWGENGMQFSGAVTIPAYFGHSYQVVIYIYYDNGFGQAGYPVGSLNYNFSDINGSAAAFTAKQNIPYGQDVYVNWSAVLPYPSLNAARGQYSGGVYYPVKTNLIAQAVLYVDDFIVQYGTPYAFWVSL